MSAFEPVAWLQKADEIGLGVYYLKSWRGKTGEEWRPLNTLQFVDPRFLDGDYEPVMALYRELRGDSETRARNEPLLRDLLIRIGRVEAWPMPDHPPGAQVERRAMS